MAVDSDEGESVSGAVVECLRKWVNYVTNYYYYYYYNLTMTTTLT